MINEKDYCFCLFDLGLLGLGADAKVNVFPLKGGGKIISDACVMSFTDTLGKKTFVIKAEPIVVYFYK